MRLFETPSAQGLGKRVPYHVLWVGLKKVGLASFYSYMNSGSTWTTYSSSCNGMQVLQTTDFDLGSKWVYTPPSTPPPATVDVPPAT